jgi:hypothetical protein
MSGDATGKPTTAGSKPTQGSSSSSRPPVPPAPSVSQKPPSVPPKKAAGTAAPTSAAGATKVTGSATPTGAATSTGAKGTTKAAPEATASSKGTSTKHPAGAAAAPVTAPATSTGPSRVGAATAATPTASPRVSSPAPSTGAQPASAGSTTQTSTAVKKAAAGPRRVRLAVARIDPWSAMKLSFLLSIALGIMMIVATIVFWMVLDGMYVFTEVDRLVQEVLGDTADVNVLQYVEFKRVVSLATIIAIVDMVLLTALATIGAFLYNVVASLVGGVHLTLIDE